MKHALAALLLIISLPGFCQGVQKQEKIAGLNAFVYYPTNYADNKTFPAIFFFPGLGEAGTDPQKLMVNGPARFIRDGWKPDSFMVISVQPTYGWVSALIINTVLDAAIKTYKIDTSSIHLTGLSAGGSGIETYALTPGYAQKIKSLVPMSAPEIPNSHKYIPELAPLGIKWLGFSGSSDTHTTKMRILFQLLDESAPGNARFILRPGGHCCWNDIYNPSFRISESEGNIYSWMLSQGRKKAPLVIEPPVKVIQILHDPEKVKKIIILDKDGKWTEYEGEDINSTTLKFNF